MVSHQFHKNAVAAIAIGVVTFIAFTMGQSDKTICSGGCQFPVMKTSVSFLITKNVSKIDDSPDCFPISTELLYVCKDQETHQFSPSLTAENLSIKCTDRGWLNGNDKKSDAPPCEKRAKRCCSPPAITNANTVMQTDDLQPHPIYESQNLAMRFLNGDDEDWEGMAESGNGSFDIPDFGSGSKSQPHDFELLNVVNSISDNDMTRIPKLSDDGNLLRNLLIGICSFLGFVMIAALLGLLHRARTTGPSLLI